MEKNNIIHTLKGKRLTSLYAETYLNEKHCEYQDEVDKKNEKLKETTGIDTDEWQSPSDLLIGKIELIPPFTSKITRGIAHKGILAIGDNLLTAEYREFENSINRLKKDQEIVWTEILKDRLQQVREGVMSKYEKILNEKCEILKQEMNNFYENTLQGLEDHVRQTVSDILICAYANITSDLNAEIKEKLAKEKDILTKILKTKYETEVKKIKHYYKLILDNEACKKTRLVKQALYARNDALKAFNRQMEAETMTSTMYMMCTERKKCRIKQFVLDHYNAVETEEKHQKLKERILLLDSLRENERHVSDVNKNWEEKIKKILQLFFKFVSFSLKLLPEQAAFLLDLEKMLVLQLNEIQKSPMTTPILIDETEFNYFKFEKAEQKKQICDKEPFTIVGDLSITPPSSHGSRETLPSRVELPAIRLYRKFIYAKCDRYQEVAELLENVRCKCHGTKPEPVVIKEDSTPISSHVSTPEPESSYENLILDDTKIFHDCPARYCQDWLKKNPFPSMPEYEDFTEENYTRVKAILGNQRAENIDLQLVSAKDIVIQEHYFASTKEKFHHAGTQYEQQEEDIISTTLCPCVDGLPRQIKSSEGTPDLTIDQIMKKRKYSLNRILHSNPNLMKMFTDENFDFIYTVN